MMQKVVFCNKYGEKLSGILHVPKPAKKAAVIISHGLGGDKESKAVLAKELEKLGMTVLRFDFSGCGESEGNFERLTVQKHTGDLDAAVKFLKSLNKAEKIYLAGYSDGGMVAAIYASRNKSIAGVATISAVFSYMDLELLLKSINGIGYWMKKGHLHKGGPRMLVSHYKSALGFRMHSIMKRAECPFLVIHGDKDEIVSLRHAFRYYDSARQKKIHIMKGAPHFLTRKYEIESAREIGNWIKTTF